MSEEKKSDSFAENVIPEENVSPEGKNSLDTPELEEKGELKKLKDVQSWSPPLLRVHYRFVSWFHWDYIKSRKWLFIGPFHPYGILNKVYKFLADVFEYRNKKRIYIGTLTEPGIREKRFRAIYYRSMFIYTENGELDPSNEICEDTPQEFRINSDPKKSAKIFLYANLASISNPELSKDHQIQEREKEFHETVWALPINMIKFIPSLIFRHKREKLMELGELYDINNEFIKGDGDLTLNENIVRRILTLGAISFDLERRDNGKIKRVAAINRAPWKRILTFGIWKDYYIKIYEEEYDKMDFKIFLSLVTDFINNRGRVKRNVPQNMHLRVPVRNIMRYST